MNLSKLTVIAKLATTKNRCILANPDRPAKKGCVNLDWWVRPDAPDTRNLGDYLSPVIVEWMLARRGLLADQPVGKTRFLTAVGSILGTGLNDSTVWGSGFLKGNYAPHVRPALKKLDVRAVRGPRTAESLRARGYTCPDVYGDPAILMPLIYDPSDEPERSGVLYASHFKDAALFDGDVFDMQTDDWRVYVDAARASELVVTTSLHGIILAECYGTPAVLVESSRGDYSPFKYEDWYFSTGRREFPIVHTVEEALHMEPAPLPKNVAELREQLMEVFPYDLWEA